MDIHLNRLLDLKERVEIEDFYPKTYLYKLLETSKQIDKGGTGTEIYQDGDYIIKITVPCKYIKQKPYPNIEKECQLYKGSDKILKVPQSDKILLSFINSLSEGLIGGYLNKLKLYTPHFVETLDIAFNPAKSFSLLLSKFYQTDLYKVINNKGDILILFFQISQALSAAQEFYRFTHYDLHLGNLFYEIKENKNYPIIIDGELQYFKLDTNVQYKIADFGFSRLETQYVAIEARMTNFGLETWGFFNPYYDILGVYGYLFWDKRLIGRQVNEIIDDEFLQELTDCFTGGRITPTQFMHTHFGYTKNNNPFWRPKVDKSNKIMYFDLPSMVEITSNLAKLIIKHNRGQIVNTVKNSYHRLPSYFVSYPKRMPIQLDDNHPFKITQLPIGKLYSFERLSSIPLPPYILTPTDRMILHCPDNLQYIHIFFTNSKFKFIIDCCKLDMYNWIRNKFGLAINGGFFSLKGDFKPIGPYSQINGENYWHSNLSISKPYKPYYGLLYLENNSPKLYKGEIPLTGQYFASGPILLYNNEIVMTEKLLQENKNNVKLWQCTKSKDKSKDKYIKNDEFYNDCNKVKIENNFMYPNCEKIEPGELSHAGNPNPRSMIVWRQDNDGLGDIALVVVEGREIRGDGMTLYQMAKLAKSIGGYQALNLDGGRSSNMVWRTRDQSKIINTINPQQMDSYPVGDLLAIIDNI